MDETVRELYSLILGDDVQVRQAKGSNVIRIGWHSGSNKYKKRYRWFVIHIDGKRGKLWRSKTKGKKIT